MRIYGFVGPSGTGKSYRVTALAKTHKIPLIIDDGLLISSTGALAGISAKGEKTKFASVKRALFFDPKHAEAVKNAIRKEKKNSLMIVGTSVAMIEKIAARLELPPPEKMIDIRDVSTEEERETAKRIRKTEGKHVIPVPTVQIRKDFSGYWLDPLQIFRPVQKEAEGEKTLVRPTYSYFGEFTISHGVLVTICSHEVKSVPGVTRLWKCGIEERGRSIIVHVEVNLKYGTNILEATEKIRSRVTENVSRLTAILVEKVQINVKSLTVK